MTTTGNPDSEFERMVHARELVLQHCHSVPDPTGKDLKRYCKYEAGWSDARIARMARVSEVTVKRIRSNKLGSTRIPAPPRAAAPQPDLFNADFLTRRVTALEALVKELTSRPIVTAAPMSNVAQELLRRIINSEKRLDVIEDKLTAPTPTNGGIGDEHRRY